MAHGLEGRVPYLDHRVVEFGLGLAQRLKIAEGQGKYVLKKWGERLLPREHLYRRKRGFHVPTERVLAPDVLARLQDVLVRSEAVRQWMNPAGVRALIERQRSKGDAILEVWSVLYFVLWHRLFVELPVMTSLPREGILSVLG